MSEITIIIPCYNHGRFLREAVQSVMDQTVDVEKVVVVDDGSDEPGINGVLEEVGAMDRVTVIRQPNQGPSAARNRAMQEVDTPFVASLDADDRLLPEFVEELLPAIKEGNSVGIVYGQAKSFGKQDAALSTQTYRFPEVLLDPCIYSTAIFRTADWKAVGGFREEMRKGWEDFEFWISIIETGRDVVFVEKPVFEYRRHECSRDSDFSASRKNLLDAFECIYRHHKDLYSRNIRLLFEAHLERLQWRDRFFGKVSPELRYEQCGEEKMLGAETLVADGERYSTTFRLEFFEPDRGELRFDPFNGAGEFQLKEVSLLGMDGKILWKGTADSVSIVSHSFATSWDNDSGEWPTFFFLGRDPRVVLRFPSEAKAAKSHSLKVTFQAKIGESATPDLFRNFEEFEEEFNQSMEKLHGTELELAHVKEELQKELGKRREIQRSQGYKIGRLISRVFRQ